MKQLSILLLSLTSLIIVEATSVNPYPIINRNNLFAVDIFKALYEKDTQNILVCPFAAYTGLSLIRSGANDGSADQLRKVLYGSHNLTEDELAFKQLLQDMERQIIRTDVFNGIFVDERYKIRDEYQQRALDIFNANTSNIDLSKTHEAAKIINEWIKNVSNSTIETIISPDDIRKDTRIIVLNALHFKASWFTFDPSVTVDQIFFRPGFTNVKVKTMVRTRFYGLYAENKKLKAKFLELPFITSCPLCLEPATLIIVLPNEIDGVDDLQSNVNEVLSPQNFTRRPLNVYLPRFQDNKTIDFQAILERFGANHIFSSAQANFEKIAGKPGDIYLNNYQQGVSLRVDEQGVEAVGTAEPFLQTRPPLLQEKPVNVGSSPGSSAPPDNCCPEEPIDFRVNHPFLYYVKVYGLITFVGKIYDPPIVPYPVEA